MTSPPALQEFFPAHPHHWPRLLEAVEGCVSRLGLGDGVLFRLTVCLDELFTNTVKQGPESNGEERRVRLTLRSGESGALLVLYEDDAPPFDPVAWLEGHRLGEQEAPQQVGGVGIQMLEGLTRELRYERDEPWNRISFAMAAEHEES
ncbi:MAG: ATP-binding protein [Magnetococcales bacterium]|nr:ATP-binding protein [Magnetococcales bacterium]